MITLILGGNKSGKSDYALSRLAAAPGPSLFVATGKARDASFREQIMKHRRERAADLPVLEVGPGLPASLGQAKEVYKSILVDSLDFWLFACREAGREDAAGDLLRRLERWSGPDLYLVSCEIGLGPLPATSESRAFIRELGSLNTAVARIADEAVLVAAGLPLTLKPR